MSPAPCHGLVLGRGIARFRHVRLGGYKVRKVRCNAVAVHDAADFFLYRDASIAPLLDMRRRFKAVMDVLCHDSEWQFHLLDLLNLLVSGVGFLLLVLRILLPLVTLIWFRVLGLVSFIVSLLMFIVVLVILFMLFVQVVMRLCGDGGIGFLRILWFIPKWLRTGHHFFLLMLMSHLVVLGVLADPARIDEGFRKAWLPYFCRSGQRDTSLEEFSFEVEGWPCL